MSGENCLVCATDEGVFLDIVENPTLMTKALNCGLEKITEKIQSTKICHKCAFEIEQCSHFFEKVKVAANTPNSKKNCCILCFDPYKEDIFFDLSKQTFGVNDFVQRIHDLFTDDFKDQDLQKQLVCLCCRYCVDLLTDLRNLSEVVCINLTHVIKNGIHPADLPKTKTSIVSRNTTFIQSSNLHLNTPSDTESDSSSIMAIRKKTKKNVQSAVARTQEKCQKCKAAINGVNIYKIHATKSTVCKKCWLCTDHGKTHFKPKSKYKKRKKINCPETKLCSTLLEDILHYSWSINKEFITEKDDQGNTLFKVNNQSRCESRTEVEIHYPSSSLLESQKKEKLENVEAKKVLNQEVSEAKSVKSRQRKDSDLSIQDISDTKPTRSRQNKESEQSSQEEHEIKSIRSSRRRKDSEQSIKVDNEINTSKITRASRRRKESEQSIQGIDNEKSARVTRRRKDSEQSTRGIGQQKLTRITRGRKDSVQSSQAESEVRSVRSTRSRKDSEQSLQGTLKTTNLPEIRKRKASEQSIQEEIEINVDVDSDTAPVSKKTKESETKVEPKQSSKSKSQSGSTARKRERSSSVESTLSVRKSTRNTRKNKVQDLDEIIEIVNESDEDSVHQENVSDNDSVIPKSKRVKRSDSISSKESMTTSQFKAPSNKNSPESTPSNKSSPESTPSTRDRLNEVFNDKISILKSQHVESSESEEIDILKSTDEETKGEDTLEIEPKDKDVSEPKLDEEKLNEEEKEKITEETNTSSELNVKITEDDSFSKDDEDQCEDKNPNTSPLMNNSTKLNAEENSKLVLENKAKSEDREVTDFINNGNNIIVDDESENEEQPTVSRRSLANSNISRIKSKSLGRRKSKKEESISTNNEIVYHTSDSEESKNLENISEAYTCSICDKVFENKFIGLQHELGHMNVLEIKLERVETSKVHKSSSESNTSPDNSVKTDSSPSKSVIDEDKVEKEIEKSIEMNKEEIDNDEATNSKESNDAIEEILNSNTDKVETEEIQVLNETERIEESSKEPIEQTIENETFSDKSENEQNNHVEEKADENTIKKHSQRRSTRNIDYKSDRKSRARRNIIMDLVETQQETHVLNAQIEDDKITEAVKETLNEIAELQGKIQAASVKNGAQETDQSTSNVDENIMKTVELTETSKNDNFNETAEISQNDENEVVMEVNQKQNETSKFDDDNIESDLVPSNDQKEKNNEDAFQVVDVDTESPTGIEDVEHDENVKPSEEPEIEIAEVVGTDSQTIEPAIEIICQQVDLTENDGSAILRPGDDIEIEEIIDTDKIEEIEHTVDSVSEINVTVEEEACVENNVENVMEEPNEVVHFNNDGEDNNIEDEEALAQQSLEELLQRKGLQIVDEFAESVTDGDEESEKEVNHSSEKENCPEKDGELENELEIKISDAECTEILGVHNRSINKLKDVEVNITGENQFIQDVDVVEEVIHDSEVVQEVEVESNGNCLDVTNNVEGHVMTNVLKMGTMDTEKRLDLQTEPISDDETDFVLQTFGNLTNNIRNNQDMPSLDPIDDGIDDE